MNKLSKWRALCLPGSLAILRGQAAELTAREYEVKAAFQPRLFHQLAGGDFGRTGHAFPIQF